MTTIKNKATYLRDGKEELVVILPKMLWCWNDFSSGTEDKPKRPSSFSKKPTHREVSSPHSRM